MWRLDPDAVDVALQQHLITSRCQQLLNSTIISSITGALDLVFKGCYEHQGCCWGAVLHH